MTTEAVLWEWLNGLSNASTRRVAAEGYRRAHADAGIEVVPFQPELIESAVQLYGTRPDKDWSLTDCLSFFVMRRSNVQIALTPDHHFEQAGFRPVLLHAPPAV